MRATYSSGIKFALASTLVFCVSQINAEAAVIETTYTGVVDSGIDYLGLFGQKGANLAGAVATTDYVYLTAAPAYDQNKNLAPYSYTVANNPGPGETYVLGGGPGQSNVSPYIAAYETINGVKQVVVAFAGSGYLTSGYNATQNYRQDYALDTYIGSSGLGFYDRISTSIGVDRSAGHVFPSAVNESANFIFAPSDSSETEFRFASNIPSSYDVNNPDLYADQTTRLFIKQNSFNQNVLAQDYMAIPTPSFDLSQSSVSAVPECSTWVMILTGFVGLGFLYRKTRSREARPVMLAA